jgi:hypothetical protein
MFRIHLREHSTVLEFPVWYREIHNLVISMVQLVTAIQIERYILCLSKKNEHGHNHGR